jgi:hypothetical protein
MTTVATFDPGKAYSIPVTVTGLVPRFVMSSRRTSLAPAGWFAAGGARVR